MELRQLEHFVAVADERHFTRAAEVLSITQSGLSASIRALERELGAQLFVRSTRSVELTDAGLALLRESRRTLASAAAGREAVAAVQGLRRGRLVVGTEEGLDAVDVPGVVARFLASHPGVELVLRQAGSTLLVKELAAGDVDVAFIATAPERMAGVEQRVLASEAMVVVCHPGHPLAGARDVPLARLAQEAFIDLSPESGAQAIAERAFAAAGVQRRTVLEVDDTEMLRAMVNHGLGIALVPAPAACRLPRISLRKGDVEYWQVSAIARGGGRGSIAARALLDVIDACRTETRTFKFAS
jgi:DNA-binding transcriptional LysR family regulator